MIPAVVFAYSGDALPLRECVRGLLAANLQPVICDDANNPLPIHAQAWIEQQGGEYRQTTFERNKNLNGTACAAGIAQELHNAALRYHTKLAVKVDADTIIIDPTPFIFQTTGICSTSMNRREAFGCVYSIARQTSVNVAREINHITQDDNSPEDVLIWRTIQQNKWTHRMIDFCRSHGAFTAVPLSFDPIECFRYAACTFGNPPAEGWRDRPLQVSQAMKRLNDCIFRLANQREIS